MNINTIFNGSQKQIEFIESFLEKRGKECYIYTEIEDYTKEYLSVFFYDLNTDENDIIYSISLNDSFTITIKDIVKEFDNFYNDNY